jgi:hypothetical protein
MNNLPARRTPIAIGAKAGKFENLKIGDGLWCTFALTLLIVACRPDMSVDEKSIRAVRELSNRAIAAHDTATLLLTLTPDYHVITSRNAESSTAKAMAERLFADMQAKPDLIYVRTPSAIDVFQGWKMASESGTWTGSWTENGEKIQLTGTYYAKWHKVGDQWLIRAEIFTPVNCVGGAYCEPQPF